MKTVLDLAMLISKFVNVILCLERLSQWLFSNKAMRCSTPLYRGVFHLVLFSFFMTAAPAPFAHAQSGSERDLDDEYERIVTEEDFVERIVGKTLEYESGAVIIFLEDRSFGGGYSGSRVWGEWVWREDQLCHQMNIGEKRYKVACKVPQIMKKRLRFVREDGSFYGVAKIR